MLTEEEKTLQDAYKTLLALIAPLCGGVSRPADTQITDYRALCLLAGKHSVANLLYLALKEDPALPDDLRQKLRSLVFGSMRQQTEQEYQAARLFEALEKAGISYMPMKGMILRPLYPAPEMRISSDVDVFYDKKERQRMAEIMAALGYSCCGSDANHEEYLRGPVLIEMHHNLMVHYKTIDTYYQNIWDRLLPDGPHRYKMSDEDFYIYQTIHTVKHFTEGGTGIRSVLDVFVYLQAKPELDMGYIERELASIGLLDFHRTYLTLARVYFGGEECPDTLRDVSDYVLGSGTYGDYTHSVANKATAKGGKWRFYISRAFPRYGLMAEKYPSLRRFPPALPFYWLGRLLSVFFGRRDEVRRVVQTMNTLDPEDQKKVDGVLRHVGLYGYQ